MAKYANGVYQPLNPEKYIGKSRPIYRSSWEAKFMQMCDQHPNVTSWASESQRIPYVNPVTGKASTYVPDFFIMYSDAVGKQHAEVVEIKPSSQILGNAKSRHDKLHAVVNEAKWQAARAWCNRHGIKFRIITENEIFNRPKNSKRRK